MKCHHPDQVSRPNSVLKKLFVLLIVVVTTTTTLVSAQDYRTPRKPNIVMILADDLGYGDLSSYGAPDLQTPNIDALVRGGIRLDRFYANCPVCSPTRAALLTGRYPDLAGVPGVIRSNARNSWGFLSQDAVLLPKLLSKAGYQTALIGKWHLGLQSPNTPNERGFDFFHGFLGDMMDDYYTHLRHGTNYMRRDTTVITPEGHATDVFSDWAVNYLESRATTPEPFFLYLAYNAPHTPIQPPAAWVDRFRVRHPDVPEKRARLAALIEHMDSGIGRVIAALKATRLDRNTLIVFTSDNGGQLDVGANCGPLRGGKQDMFEGGIRVPACAVWPGVIPPTTRSEAVTLTMDLYPTLCAAAGVSVPGPVEGVSLLPLFLNPDTHLPERTLFWMRREGGGRYLGQDYLAVRRGNWKLMQNHPFEPFRLYDLSEDPQEEHDLSSTERGVVTQLTALLQQHLQQSATVPWQQP
jgi:arylsulfatase A-like enzyme